MAQLEKLTLFYDGACPLCQAEILFLSARNQARLLDFVDIHSEQFDPESVGISCEAAMAAMYGQLSSGELIKGVLVFPEAYRRANLPRLAQLFSLKPLQPFFKLSYFLFAKNRHFISGILGPTALRLVKAKLNSTSR